MDKTEADVYEIIEYAAGTWEIDNDGTPGGSDFTPGEIIVYDLEKAGCRVIDYTESRI